MIAAQFRHSRMLLAGIQAAFGLRPENTFAGADRFYSL